MLSHRGENALRWCWGQGQDQDQGEGQSKGA